MNNAAPSAALDNYRLQRYIVALSGIILLTKFAAWLLTGSVAIFTDALESITNVSAGLIGLYALYLSTKPRDFDHPYGHGRAEFLSATVEGAMIAIAGVIILIEAVRSILDPPDGIPNLEVGMILIIATAVANFAAGTVAVRKGSRNRSQALIASGKHLQSDSYSSFGIILGLVVLYVLTSAGYEVMWIDGAIAILFGTIILVTGALVVKRSMEGIMDKVDIRLLEQVVGTLSENRHDEWIDIHNLKIVKYGPTMHIDMHVTMPWDMSVREQYDEVCAIRALIQKKYGESVDLSVSCDPCKEFSCPGCKRECKERRAEFTKLVDWDIDNLSRDAQHGEVCGNENG
ncbi:MAG: cation diffusion facilitator family transporter [Methanomassiliicoccaceae archaeon]|nr:cation diffusion facilitator family transporter [Methanomassiliicoccaceae archaeon]